MPMGEDPVSLLCCTYGRTRLLPEVVESFRRQTYAGPMQLVILNDAPDQHISCSVSGVECFNVDRRFDNFGEKKRAANKLGIHRLRLTVDDDDVFLPHFVEDMVNGLLSVELNGIGFYLASHHIGSKGVGESFRPALKGRGPGGIPSFTTGLYDLAEGHPSMHSGADQIFLSRMRKHFKDLNQPSCRPGYIYRWSNGVHHLSAGGPNRPEHWEAAQISYDKNTIEKKGDIHIEPKWEIDYVKACAGVMAQWEQGAVTTEEPSVPMVRIGKVQVPAHMAHLIRRQ